ncbi:MAG: DNA translocase FtsK [Clostridiales bacterium]|nr:DNA translocase FtsK [Clostridiales bacterium]
MAGTGHSTKKKKTNRTSKPTNQSTKVNSVQNEILLIIVTVVAVLILLSYFNLCGMIGNVIKQVMLGLFGYLAYVLPVVLFLGIAFILANQNNRNVQKKIPAGILLLFFADGLIHLIYQAVVQADVDAKIGSLYKAGAGGGVIGGMLYRLFFVLLGEAGAAIVFVAAILICVIIITEKLFFAKISSLHQDKRKKRPVEIEEMEPEEEPAQEKREDNHPITYQFKDRKRKGKKLPTSEEMFGQEEADTGKKKKKREKNQVDMKEISIEEQFDNIPIHRAQPPVEEVAAAEPSAAKHKSTDTAKQQEQINDIEKEIAKQDAQKKAYVAPSINLLSRPKSNQATVSDKELKKTAMKLQQTLESFGVRVTVNNVSCGPTVTRYELQPEQGVKVSRITALSDDIKLNLAAADIRIEAPIPGKAAVGIEVPNTSNTTVMLRELLESKSFQNAKSKISFAVGKDIGGQTIVTDIKKMPHLLIAGATGSGKSVCINTLIMSILYKASPDEVRLIMIDPKVVELSVYNGIPHLMIPVVTDPKKASAALNWAVKEMTDRYQKFADLGVRDLVGYNEKVPTLKEAENQETYQKLPQIVIIVDELADLMMVASNEVEDAICRLAQLARAAGIHLVIATQRPSVNVITGVIKANIPSRIAFAVSSAVDSRTILDGSGAEKLLGKGDMLFYPSGQAKPSRVQGAFVSDQEVSDVVEFLKRENECSGYNEEVTKHIETAVSQSQPAAGTGGTDTQDGRDEYFEEAGRFIIEKDKASIGMLQRVYRIGFNRAARIMDQLCEAGVVGEEEGTKPRKVLMSLEEFDEMMNL